MKAIIIVTAFFPLIFNHIDSIDGRHFGSDRKQGRPVHLTTALTGKKTTSLNCGDALYGPSGSIIYKKGEPYGSGERCTWIVHVPNASSISFKLEENGFIQMSEDFIKVGYFLDSDFKNEDKFHEVDLNHNTEDKSVVVPGPVVFVRFFSDDSINGLGFRVDFMGLENKTSPFKFSKYYFNKKHGMIQYPLNGEPSSEFERVVFVLKPPVTIYMALKFFNGNCEQVGDYLTIYQRVINGWTKNGLQTVAQFCNSSVTDVPFWTLSKEVIITFQTSSLGEGNSGFQLIWVPSKP